MRGIDDDVVHRGVGPLAAGSFDADPYDDLAISAPVQSVTDNGDHFGAGAVYIVAGSASGPVASGATVWSEAGPVPGFAGDTEYFGLSLAVGNFDANAYADLAVGVPGEGLPGVSRAGAVVLLYGAGGGLSATGSVLLTQDTPGVKGVAETDDNFGLVLASGDFGRDGFDDLVVGTPDEDLEGTPTLNGAGALQVFSGSPAGIAFAGDQLIDRRQPGIPLSPASVELFGDALAAGDFNRDGVDDLVVGVDGQAYGILADVGAIQLLRGALFAAGFEGGDTAEWGLTSP
ncbi:MAG TPA: integrin alpha [Thermoanaerobaculia bacterium]|jgi:hypothetical protein|nr:integrin alpha [Thermoanaerobaculia bacterium]